MVLEERLTDVGTVLPALRMLVLFGSAARGSTRADSDIDVAVLLNETEDTTQHRMQIEAALGRAAGRDVDVVYLLEAPPQLRFEIARDGRLLFERAPHTWADFRARAMIDWWDWAPTARLIHAAAVTRLREQTSHGSS